MVKKKKMKKAGKSRKGGGFHKSKARRGHHGYSVQPPRPQPDRPPRNKEDDADE